MRTQDQRPIWFNVSQKHSDQIKGVRVGSDSVHVSYRRGQHTLNSLPDGEYIRVYTRIPASFGAVTIDRLVPVYFLDRSDAEPFRNSDHALIGWGATIPVSVAYDILVYAGRSR